MRLIDADALKASVLKWMPPDPCGNEEREYPFETDICVSMLMEIEEAPTVTLDHLADADKKVSSSRGHENDKDAIYRQDAIDAINTWDKFGVDERGRLVRWHEGLEPYVHLRDVLTAIVNLPSAQPEQAIKDCRNCKHGKYNDHLETYFCYNPNECIEWNLWEPIAQLDRKTGKWSEKEVIHKAEAKTVIEEWQSCKCSVCGRYDTRPYLYYFDDPHFCSWCGADMRGEQNG